MKEGSVSKSVYLLLLIVLVYLVLVTAKSVLVPVVFAAIFSMLLLPVSIKMEDRGVSRGMATLISVLLLVFIVALISGLVGYQVSDLAKNADEIEKNLVEKFNQLREFATNSLGISREKQDEIIKEQQKSSNTMINSLIKGSITSAGIAITNIILVLVYIFLFMYFRTHLKKFVLMKVKKGSETKAIEIMRNGRMVAQKYLTGLAMMIGALWVMYGIGFSIAGVRNSIFFAVLCGLLEIVPFVGNLSGVVITLFVSLGQGADSNVLLGILVTYSVVQFFQTYFLEPLVVGREVNVHPLFTILGLVVGEFIWGIPGMILAIPLMGIAKIIFDRVEPLRHYGYLIGEEKKHDGSGIKEKIKSIFGKSGSSKKKQ